jgi:hypothetical protein
MTIPGKVSGGEIFSSRWAMAIITLSSLNSDKLFLLRANLQDFECPNCGENTISIKRRSLFGLNINALLVAL